MRQVKINAIIYCAVLLSVIFINNTIYRGVAAAAFSMALLISASVENTRFVDFIQQHCPLAYLEMKKSGFERGLIWDFAKQNSKKGACDDEALYDNSRRYVFGCYLSIAAAFVIPFTAIYMIIHS